MPGKMPCICACIYIYIFKCMHVHAHMHMLYMPHSMCSVGGACVCACEVFLCSFEISPSLKHRQYCCGANLYQ